MKSVFIFLGILFQTDYSLNVRFRLKEFSLVGH
jgi:hypothetical protein